MAQKPGVLKLLINNVMRQHEYVNEVTDLDMYDVSVYFRYEGWVQKSSKSELSILPGPKLLKAGQHSPLDNSDNR